MQTKNFKNKNSNYEKIENNQKKIYIYLVQLKMDKFSF